MPDGSWGVIVDADAADVGDALEVVVVTRSGKSWPELVRIVWAAGGMALGAKIDQDECPPGDQIHADATSAGRRCPVCHRTA